MLEELNIVNAIDGFDLKQDNLKANGTISPYITTKTTAAKTETFSRNSTINPYIISHPLYSPFIRLSSNNERSMRTMASMIATTFLPDTFTFERSAESTSLPESSRGINCLSLNNEESRLAVGRNDGILSFYEVDKVQYYIKLRRDRRDRRDRRVLLRPFPPLDMGRAISCIAWIQSFDENPEYRPNDEIVIGFSFSSDICVYNLSLPSEDPEAKQTLIAVGSRSSFGHTALVFWTRASQEARESDSSKVLKAKTHIIAGTSNGFIRCWKKTADGGKFLWNVKIGAGVTCAVVATILLSESNLLAVSEDGLFTIWDLSANRAVCFSFTGNEPALLHSFNLRSDMKMSELENGKVRKVTKATYDSNIVLVGLYNGAVHEVDICKRKVISTCSSPRTKPAVIRQLSDATFVGNYEALRSYSQSTAQRTIDVGDFCQLQLTGREVLSSFCTLPGNTKLQYNSIGKAIYNDPFSVANAALKCPLIHHDIFTGSIHSSLLKSCEFSFTLPGRVVRAEPGDFEIQVSHDLQLYLGNAWTSSAVLSKSLDIRFEWSLDGNAKGLLSFSESLSSVDRVIASVRPYHVTLTEPYCGPTVSEGLPHVQMRTMLLPHQFPMHSLHRLEDLLPNCKGKGMDGNFSENVVDLSITALCSLSTVPLVFAGTKNNQISVLSLRGPLGSDRDDRDDNVDDEDSAESVVGDDLDPLLSSREVVVDFFSSAVRPSSLPFSARNISSSSSGSNSGERNSSRSSSDSSRIMQGDKDLQILQRLSAGSSRAGSVSSQTATNVDAASGESLKENRSKLSTNSINKVSSSVMSSSLFAAVGTKRKLTSSSSSGAAAAPPTQPSTLSNVNKAMNLFGIKKPTSFK